MKIKKIVAAVGLIIAINANAAPLNSSVGTSSQAFPSLLRDIGDWTLGLGAIPRELGISSSAYQASPSTSIPATSSFSWLSSPTLGVSDIALGIGGPGQISAGESFGTISYVSQDSLVTSDGSISDTSSTSSLSIPGMSSAAVPGLGADVISPFSSGANTSLGTISATSSGGGASSSVPPLASSTQSVSSIPTSLVTSITGSSLQSPFITSSSGATGAGSIANSIGNIIAIPSGFLGSITGFGAATNSISLDASSTFSVGSTASSDGVTSATLIPSESIGSVTSSATGLAASLSGAGTSITNLGGSALFGAGTGAGSSSFLPPSSIGGGSMGGAIAASSPGIPSATGAGSSAASLVAPSVAGPLLGILSWVGGAIKPKTEEDDISSKEDDIVKPNCPTGKCGNTPMFGAYPN